MGTQYKGVCLDCRKNVDLDKFYDFPSAHDAEVVVLEKAQEPMVNATTWYRAYLLMAFVARHDGHRISVIRDSEERWWDEARGTSDEFPQAWGP